MEGLHLMKEQEDSMQKHKSLTLDGLERMKAQNRSSNLIEASQAPSSKKRSPLNSNTQPEIEEVSEEISEINRDRLVMTHESVVSIQKDWSLQ